MTVDSAAATTTTSGRVYPVAVDKSGYLSVSVPWTAVTETTVRNWGFTKNEGTLTDVDLFVGGPDAKEDGATTNGNTYLNLLMNSGIRSVHNIVGSGHTTVTSDASGTITINSTVPDISNLVPYTGASKDVNLGNHSLFMSNKTGNNGTPTIKLSAKGLSEDDCYCKVSPTSIFIQDPGSSIVYGDNYIDSNGIKIYLPGNNYIPDGSETFVLKSNLSTLLDKGTENSSMVTDQVIYNPVEMQKRLTLPSVGGRKIRIDGISGNEAPLFLLKGAASGNDHISALILSSLPIGATDISTLSATKIEQRAGSFTIQHRKYKTETDSILSPVFGFNEDHG